MGLLKPYIKPSELKNIDSYKYSSSGQGLLDPYLNYWWNYLTEKTPEYVAPNVLTIMGFGCTIVCFILSFIIEHFIVTPWVERIFYFSIAILIFAYQTLDAMDGKQARKIKQSSPLGQMLDHGCDTIATILLSYGSFNLYGTSLFCNQYVLFAAQFYCFYFMWWDLHFHVFRCSMSWFSVTELQIMLVCSYIAAAIFGPKIFEFTLFDTLPLTFKTFPIIQLIGSIRLMEVGLILFITPMIVFLLTEAFTQLPKLNKSNGKSQILMQITHLLIQVALAFIPASSDWPLLRHFTITLNNAIILLRLMSSAIFQVPCSSLHYPLIPYYICSFIFIYDSIFFNSLTIYFPPIMFLVFIWELVYYYDLVTTLITDLCTHLSIQLWKVTTTTTSQGEPKKTK